MAALIVGLLNQRWARTTYVLAGAVLITVALLPANLAELAPLMGLWLLAGDGQNLVNLPTKTLIADRTSTQAQGRIYGAHFAWSHFWWAFAYPVAEWIGIHAGDLTFFYGGLMGLTLLLVVQLTLSPKEPASYWHDHPHLHDDYHQHEHSPELSIGEPHSHPHLHLAIHFHHHPYG